MSWRRVLAVAVVLSACALGAAGCDGCTSAGTGGTEGKTIEDPPFYDHVDTLLQEQGLDAAVEYIKMSVQVGDTFSSEGETFKIRDIGLCLQQKDWVIGHELTISSGWGQHRLLEFYWHDLTDEDSVTTIRLQLSF